MPEKLQEKFSRFTKAARLELQKFPLDATIVSSAGEKKLQIQIAVSDLERKPEFQELVSESQARFYGDYHKGSKTSWERAVKNFFRRSEYYHHLFCGRTIGDEDTYRGYLHAFERRKMQVRYFAPMEDVAFAENSMDFGAFQIRRFKAEELGAILGNAVNEVFYPSSIANVNRLGYWWLLCATESVSALPLGIIDVGINLEDVYRVRPAYAPYPAPVESAVQVLTLFDWQVNSGNPPENPSAEQQREREMERSWCGFQIPFVLRVENNLLQPPPAVPFHWIMAPGTDLDEETFEHLDPADVLVWLNREETESLKTFVHSVSNRLSALQDKRGDWRFMEVALSNLVKGFFSTELDQLLWHITVLEALVGERGKGVTDRLASRLSSMLGKDGDERKTLAEQFRELYKIRSELVHGASPTKDVFVGHLRMGRDLARKSVLWFLSLLTVTLELAPGMGSALPTREEFLKLVDATPEERHRFQQLISYAEKLPTGFPYVQDWVK